MTSLTDFPITSKWPPVHPERLQLYMLGTPNGLKISIALEEMELPYDYHLVSFSDNDQMSPEFLSLNPNNKIPAIIDPNGPNGEPLPLWESGAILLYLAEKTGKLISDDPAKRLQTIQWVMWQMGGLGPMFGQVGFFHKFAGAEYEDKRPLQRYLNESKRLLGVLNQALEGKEYLLDDFSIADVTIFPWLATMVDFYGAADLVDWDSNKNIQPYLDRCLARPAVQRGLNAKPVG